MPFSPSPSAHVGHVRAVLDACRQHKVYLKRSKLKLCMRAVRFLGHVVHRDGCRPRQDKVASVRDWPDLETVTHVRQFLGMCGFYRWYIQSFAHLAHPLTRLTKLGVDWVCVHYPVVHGDVPKRVWVHRDVPKLNRRYGGINLTVYRYESSI